MYSSKTLSHSDTIDVYILHFNNNINYICEKYDISPRTVNRIVNHYNLEFSHLVLSALNDIKKWIKEDNSSYVNRTGICILLSDTMVYKVKEYLSNKVYNGYYQFANDIAISLTKRHFKSWKHYSGHIGYPIPVPTRMKKPMTVDSIYHSRVKKWSGAYGKLRIDLLNHLINEFEKICK